MSGQRGGQKRGRRQASTGPTLTDLTTLPLLAPLASLTRMGSWLLVARSSEQQAQPAFGPGRTEHTHLPTRSISRTKATKKPPWPSPPWWGLASRNPLEISTSSPSDPQSSEPSYALMNGVGGDGIGHTDTPPLPLDTPSKGRSGWGHLYENGLE